VTQKRYAVVGLFGAVATLGVGNVIGGSPAGASTPGPSGNDPAEVYFGAAAACVGRNAVSTHEVFVDGVSVGWGINKTMIQGGSTVKVAFTAAVGCDPTQFGLAVYSNPSSSANPTYDDVMKQTYATSKVQTVAGGQMGEIEISLPAINDCYYQVDFFTGPVIQKFGPDFDNFYGSPEDRLIAAEHIAKPNCVEVAETTTTVRPTTTTTALVTTSTAPNTTNTTTNGPDVLPDETPTRPDVPEVLGEIINGTTSTTEQPAEVLAENLAATGGNSLGLTALAGAFALGGGALTVASAALRRRRDANSGGR
jgi:hypothetical protein